MGTACMFRLMLRGPEMLFVVCCSICIHQATAAPWLPEATQTMTVNQFPDASWSATAVRLIDYNRSTNTFLFRSAVPRNTTHTFARDDLVRTFRRLIREQPELAGLELTEDPYLIDINFLDPGKPKEHNDIEQEREWFTRRPSDGELHNWALYGVDPAEFRRACPQCASQDPARLPLPLRRRVAIEYERWMHRELLPTRLRMIRKFLDNAHPAGRPVFVFGHCECGCDRTGEFFGAYELEFQSRSFEVVLTRNLKIVEMQRHRQMLHPNFQALLWYCWHLSYTGHKHLHCGTMPKLRALLKQYQQQIMPSK